MTTNDQFVMNHVPLEEWSVLQREGCHVRVRNVENSRKESEYFKFVGLSNFAFLEMDFVNGPPPVEEAAAHVALKLVEEAAARVGLTRRKAGVAVRAMVVVPLVAVGRVV